MNKALVRRILSAMHPRNWLYCRPPIDAIYVGGYKARWYVPRAQNDDDGGSGGGGNGPDGPQDPDPIDPAAFDEQLRNLIEAQKVPV